MFYICKYIYKYKYSGIKNKYSQIQILKIFVNIRALKTCETHYTKTLTDNIFTTDMHLVKECFNIFRF